MITPNFYWNLLYCSEVVFSHESRWIYIRNSDPLQSWLTAKWKSGLSVKMHPMKNLIELGSHMGSSIHLWITEFWSAVFYHFSSNANPWIFVALVICNNLCLKKPKLPVILLFWGYFRGILWLFWGFWKYTPFSLNV